MKRPSFQFYPADWKKNIKLRRCSEAARGAWMDVLCALHESEEYGVVRWPLLELAQVAGVALKLVKELVDKAVLKGGDKGRITYVHTPRHAGKDGEPVTLVDLDGPCWYSSRMVRDEWLRARRGASTRFGADNQADGSEEDNTSPSRSPTRRVGEALGGGSGDGASSSSSSSSSESSLRSDSRSNVHELPLPKPPLGKRGKDPDDFAEFYAAFPLKKSRGAALKAWPKAVAKALPAEIIAAAKRYAISRKGEDPKYTAHPATWLSHERWLDDLPGIPIAGAPAPSVANGRAPGETPEHFKVRRFKEIGLWLSPDGPPPTDPDCCMPHPVLIEFGYRQDVSRETGKA